MASNPLEDIFGAKVRGRVYALFALMGVLIGAVQAAFTAVPGSDVPTAVTVALAVYAYVGIALGFTAASNTKNKPDDGVESTEAGVSSRARSTA